MAYIVPLDVCTDFTDHVGRFVLTAASIGNLSEVARLIAIGGDPTYRHPRTGSTPLKAAALNGHFKVVKYLIETACVFPCPYVACESRKKGHREIADFLWEYTSPICPQSSFYCFTGLS